MNQSSSILVVDDDKEIVQLVKSYLEQAQFHVLTAYDGEHALHVLRRERPDLVILDLMLPDRDGWDITRIIRADETLKRTPIIMLTARIDDSEKLIGLELGADDYITKPFNPREVVARVRSVLRRMDYAREDFRDEKVLQCGDIVLSMAKREVTVLNNAISLTPTEFKILQILMGSPNYVFTRSELVEKAFGYNYDNLDRTLDTHIRNLRKKLEPNPDQPIYLMTVYGIGYKIVEPD